jgi:hypothetical protein
VKIHVINHHFWPDASPSAVLEEGLADALRDLGHDTVLVCGSGHFHDGERPQPASPIKRLSSHETGNRRSQLAVVADYLHFYRAIRHYVRDHVADDEAVLATSSPFLNSFLIRTLRRHAPRAQLIFHLHDYLPSNLRSLGLIQRALAPILRWRLDKALHAWDLVIACCGNIDYQGSNRQVARFWPTIDRPIEPRTVDSQAKRALYAGNLSIVHDIPALTSAMTQLHDDGWDIDVFADGPSLKLLPEWVKPHGFVSGDDYLDILYAHPVHLVAGVRGTGTGAFPSKTLNSLAVGAKVRPCGFQPEMLDELRILEGIDDLWSNRQAAAVMIDQFLNDDQSSSAE